MHDQCKKGKTKEEIKIEIEMIINQNLYEKKIITSEMYNKVNERLLKMKSRFGNEFLDST